jgi:hypothetical protein
MTFARLPETVQTLYAELLDQLRIADAEATVAGMTGPFVSKTIRGRTYWYLQRNGGTGKRQIYLGVESPQLLARIEQGAGRRESLEADAQRRREMVAMLTAGGMLGETAAVATVLRVLAEASVFRAGGVLVGTEAFRCLANLLGVRFESGSLGTADVDVAHDIMIPLGLREDESTIPLLERLRVADPGFFAVPGLDAGEPSTSFKVRGRDLRVDFLTTMNSRQRSTRPVYLRHLGVAAQPLEGLDYLIDGAIDAVVIAGNGLRVNVPSPARFALHKLWVAQERPASETAKARKDVRQAEQLLAVLLDDRPGDIDLAWTALPKRPSMRKPIRSALRRLDETMKVRMAQIIGA